jgi:eukaryotic-like serine/threonine-protein kinase
VKHPEPYKPGAKAVGFNVLTELGRGAASIIYLVQDPKTKQIWALKHVHRSSGKDARFLNQAEREHEIASKLDHPAIRKSIKMVKSRSLMTVTDLYLVMEYVDGISLEQQRPRDLVHALTIFKEVADGMAYMHARGFVHADMKPNNICITDDDHVKVIDLGQSCPVGTVKERIQGTPDYIAPEQVHRRPITPQTDIYNLGATMYWVLTGQHIPTALPKGDSLVGSLDDQFIEKPKPAIELNPRIPERLNELVMQCVEVDAENRPRSMDDVASRLDLIRAKLIAQSRASSEVAAVGDDEDEDAPASR